MKFKVKTWYDTITQESANRCDYESLGNEMRESVWDTLDEAVEHALDNINCLSNEDDLKLFKANPEAYGRSVVLYSADPVTDYTTGEEDMYTAAIEILKGA